MNTDDDKNHSPQESHPGVYTSDPEVLGIRPYESCMRRIIRSSEGKQSGEKGREGTRAGENKRVEW